MTAEPIDGEIILKPVWVQEETVIVTFENDGGETIEPVERIKYLSYNARYCAIYQHQKKMATSLLVGL